MQPRYYVSENPQPPIAVIVLGKSKGKLRVVDGVAFPWYTDPSNVVASEPAAWRLYAKRARDRAAWFLKQAEKAEENAGVS